MKRQRFINVSWLLLFAILPVFLMQNSFSQTVIGLDNWYNHETNAKTGKPFHYLWSDTEFSGYSRWGEIFTARGAKITTVARPDAKVLKKINIYIIVDPDTTSESASPNYLNPEEIAVIKKWVQGGGVLAVFANDGITILDKFKADLPA